MGQGAIDIGEWWPPLGWMVLVGLGYMFVLPLLLVAGRADSLSELAAPRRHRSLRSQPASPAGLPSVRQSGYLGLVLERLAIHTHSMLRADEVCVFTRDPRAADETLIPVVGVGVDPDVIGRRYPLNGGPAGVVIASGRPTVTRAERTTAVAPLSFGGRVQGAVWVVHDGRGKGFGLPQLALLGELAQLVGQALGHQARRELSASDPQAEVEGLLRTLARIELAGGDHGADVTELSGLVADELALSTCDRLELELGAHLHDVGKLRMPPHILCKPGPLTDAEWQVMRLHPLWGAEMVASIPGLEAVSLVVRSHHERWDGCGYPDGLAGDEIPLASRIIAICDAFSAMTSHRPYRPALDPAAALLELDAGAGAQFDPDLTKIFARALGAAVRKETDNEGREAELRRMDGDGDVGGGVPRRRLGVGPGPEGHG